MESLKTFEPCVVGGISLRNRIAMAPMTRRMGTEDGIPTQEKIDYYQRRAKQQVRYFFTPLIVAGGIDHQRRNSYRLSSLSPRSRSSQI